MEILELEDIFTNMFYEIPTNDRFLEFSAAFGIVKGVYLNECISQMKYN